MSNINTLVDLVTKQLDDSKFEDVQIFESKNNFATYVIVGNAMSAKQISSAAIKISDLIKQQFPGFRISMEGTYKNSQWILIDLNEGIVHLCTTQIREQYKFEELYKSKK